MSSTDTPPAPVDPAESPAPQASYSLMKIVILILGASLLALIGAMIALAVQKIAVPAELNTITSLIAGGLVGFLTPHAAKSLSQNSGKDG